MRGSSGLPPTVPRPRDHPHYIGAGSAHGASRGGLATRTRARVVREALAAVTLAGDGPEVGGITRRAIGWWLVITRRAIDGWLELVSKK